MRKFLTQTVAAVAIAVFWCVSAVGTTIGTTVGGDYAGHRRQRRDQYARRGIPSLPPAAPLA
jgi:hypothetical protein